MNITIIGWYGTETIGDRAILAGLFALLNNKYNNCNFFIGSLYPFFTKRTINEDYDLYNCFTNKKLSIQIFNSKKITELNDAIKKSDLVIMGGGPLMHIDELSIIEYAFKKAKKINKKTVIAGCGIGPIFNKKHQKTLINIINYSNVTILRDNASKDYLLDIYQKHKKSINNKLHVSYDLSVKCCFDYLNLKNNNESNSKYIAVNLREFPKIYLQDQNKSYAINKRLVKFINNLANKYKDYAIKLIPMHYFCVGQDDREFLNKIKFNLNKTNVMVQNKNLNLRETLDIYRKADFTIGMRFHSVVFQSIVNGNNFILDYTGNEYGKISSFIEDFDNDNFYKDRYINLQGDNLIEDNFINNHKIKSKIKLDKKGILKKMEIYNKLI
ncbi:MAG: polysaccharide pyruvyl transferase family protein [Patescibacteria group bacterium]